MTYLILALIATGRLSVPAQQSPANIAIAPIYHVTVAAMLQYSPTFRRQYSRIARTLDLRVEIRPSLLGGRPADGALTRIVRRAAQIEASVQLGTAGDPVLLIAHEFEHILEQLDGVDLPSMALRHATGVRQVPGSGHFETDRAIAAGRQVSAEVQRRRPREGT
jgi:hypothetical protein